MQIADVTVSHTLELVDPEDVTQALRAAEKMEHHNRNTMQTLIAHGTLTLGDLVDKAVMDTNLEDEQILAAVIAFVGQGVVKVNPVPGAKGLKHFVKTED